VLHDLGELAGARAAFERAAGDLASGLRFGVWTSGTERTALGSLEKHQEVSESDFR